MQFKHVTLDFDGSVAVLTLDHQEVMNAVSVDMLGGLAEALDAIEDRRDEVRCLVITGAGRAFCTGANLQGRNNAQPGSKRNAGGTLETAFHPFLRRLRNLHCPIVTAVNGPAAGAGMSFALMGEKLPAEKALEWGLVNRVYDDAALKDEAMKLARDLASGPTVALAGIRRLYWDSEENSYEEQLNLEFQLQRLAGATEDFKEGVTAFLEKRPAKFKGK